ncbi:MAG: hypothetical protein KDJ35_06775 [Alphaproteobacteria bacterium]|nr:hypothetical protein [Alphaproteobacteria bacterium]
MKVFLRSALIGLLFLGITGASAQAHEFFWQDAKSKASLSYPDTWRMIHHQKPDEVLSIVAPDDGSMPMCRLRVREDLRNVIYPRRYAANVQHIDFSRDFWDAYAGEFLNANVDKVQDNSGLGRGYGSYAHISYIPDALPAMQRRALAFVSLYRDKAYIFECSSERSAFETWYPTFRHIADSIDFRKEIHELPGGDYRYFPGDGVLRIHNEPGKVAVY